MRTSTLTLRSSLAGRVDNRSVGVLLSYRYLSSGEGKGKNMATVLWIIAAILVIAGIFAIIRKQLVWGIVLIVAGLLVGPGGVSIFT